MLVPFMLLASTYPGEYRVPFSYWVLSMIVALVFAAGRRWPTCVSLILSALAVPMFATDAWGLSELVPYLGAIAVIDVTVRSSGWSSIAASGSGWGAAVLAGVALESHGLRFVAALVAVLAFVGLPVLLGLYLRAQRQLTATFRDRAHEAENRTRAEERNALARELHDLVAHHMASIVLRIGVAQHVIDPNDAAINEVLDDVRGTATDALTDIRRLLDVLRDPSVPDVVLVEGEAVVPLIVAAVDRVRGAGFQVDARIEPDLPELDALGRSTLTRVVQESMTNVMKHADREESVSLSVLRSGPGIEVSVDNALGSTRGGPGHGLIGMHERVHLIGGCARFEANDGRWTVHVGIPVRGVRTNDGELL